jgi:hypothetical protein
MKISNIIKSKHDKLEQNDKPPNPMYVVVVVFEGVVLEESELLVLENRDEKNPVTGGDVVTPGAAGAEATDPGGRVTLVVELPLFRSHV